MVKRKLTTKSKRRILVKEPEMQSFKLSRHDLPFMTLSITKQTLYWSVLMLIILVLELWILAVQLHVIDVTEGIALI